jgi:hypothetical protein
MTRGVIPRPARALGRGVLLFWTRLRGWPLPSRDIFLTKAAFPPVVRPNYRNNSDLE